MDCYEAVSARACTRLLSSGRRVSRSTRAHAAALADNCAQREEIERLNDNRQGSLLDFIEDFARRFPTYVDEYETLLTDNRIWKQRTVGIGVVSPERALQLGSPRRCCAVPASNGSAQETAV